MANTNPYASQYPVRAQVDGQKSTTLALPIAGATANTNAIDLEAASPFPSMEQVSFLGTTTAANANAGNSTNINVMLQHSATNVSANFVNVPGIGVQSITSNSAATYPATTLKIPTPDNLLQFVRLQVVQEAAGANSANAANVTFALAF